MLFYKINPTLEESYENMRCVIREDMLVFLAELSKIVLTFVGGNYFLKYIFRMKDLGSKGRYLCRMGVYWICF